MRLPSLLLTVVITSINAAPILEKRGLIGALTGSTNGQSTSTGSATGQANGPGASFGSSAFTGTNETNGSTAIQGSTYPPGTTPVASSGVSYNANGNGGSNYGSVSQGSNYSTSSSFQSQSPNGFATGGGASNGNMILNTIGLSNSYGGAISANDQQGIAVAGGVSQGVGIAGTPISTTVTIGGSLSLGPGYTTNQYSQNQVYSSY
ncbi:hypothetical protein K502DRAFT_326116 [Neoconidiobolus thromboides FSU 785]|nr:hypothetical protein K502DRAFT_326116 [Neoconidiobolus thromboides FSU 785]